MRTRVATALTVLFALAAAGAVQASSAAAATPGYKIVTLPKYGGEPSIWASDQGVLYDTTPQNGTELFRSNDGGKTWVQTTTADPSSGDDSVATDQSGAVYETNLAGSQSTGPLQADVWKSLDQGTHWIYGNNTLNTGGQNICGTSCSPFGVDREWADAYIPKGKTTNHALVALAYHDFFGTSHIWVNISTDGGKTFGPPIDIFANQNPSETALFSLASSDCNTVPTGTRIVKSGKHAGRIYVSWISSDPVQSPGSGCNITMLQSFHYIWVAWSDDQGSTWNIQMVYDTGFGHDASTPFASFTLDNQGNPYVALDAPGPPSTSPGSASTCAAEAIAGTEQTDPNCAYHVWVLWSKDGGQTWDGGGGMFPGTAATAYEVDPSKKALTDLFPTIAAGAPGHVDVSWLRTDVNEPMTPVFGKFEPGGCAGSTATLPVPPYYPPACKWQLFAAQSLNLTQKPGQETWHIQQLTTTPMHVGDICNLGIFCTPGLSNRNLLDFNSETLDPTTGCVHIAYADDNKVNKLRVANQVSGPSIQGGTCTVQAQRHHHHHHHHKHHHHHHHHVKVHRHHHRASRKPRHRGGRGFTG